MRKFFILSVLMALPLCHAASEDAVTIPVKVERDVTLITVKMGDVEIPNILLDTGMAYDGILIYNPDLKRSLDLSDAVEANIGGAGSGGGSKALMKDSADFSIGGVNFSNQRIIVLQSDIYKGFPSNGVIGYSIFGHYLTEFDYDRDVMILHDPGKPEIDGSWTSIPLYFKDSSIPWLDVSVVIDKEDPVTLSTYIDYAARDPILLLEKPGMKFSFPPEMKEVYLGRGLSGDIHGKKGMISKLTIARFELNHVDASFARAEVRSKQKDADAVIGCGALRRFNLIFDYPRKTLYLKPNTHFKDPF